MDPKISKEELTTIIANEIRSKGLNDIITIEGVKNKLQEKLKEFSSKPLDELVMPTIQKAPNEFPTAENQRVDAATENLNTKPIPQSIGMEAGAVPLEQPQEPRVAIPAELPDFLKGVEPGKIIIFDYNELSEGGENLSNKPFKTFEDPDKKRSMQDMWSSEGKTKVEVYITKFEKIGSLEFDYKNGTTKFIEKRFEPQITDANGVFNQNPYAAASKPELDKSVENYIKNNVNIEQNINDLVLNIVKNYFLTNSEKVVNAPIQESTSKNCPECSIKKEDIVGQTSDFEKIDTPKEIFEAMENKQSIAKLVVENNEIKKWKIGEYDYFFLADQISFRKCYVKKQKTI